MKSPKKMEYFNNISDFQKWLDDKSMFHMRLGLERMHAALAMLPPITFPIIQVIGTNGKGTTSAFLANLALANGIKTGLYTSPHFINPKERIKINSSVPDDKAWLQAANEIHGLGISEDLTYFETLTLMAVRIFEDANVRLAIFEAGLGGKNDATTALPAIAHCFTPIAMDHAAIIGPALADIARDKATAIKAGSEVFSAPQYPHATEIIRIKALERDIEPRFCKPLQSGLLPRDSPRHNAINAGVAISAWQWFAEKYQVLQANNIAAMQMPLLPGRFQRIPPCSAHPELLLDGAHNPHGIKSLIESLQDPPGAIFFSALKDKNWRDSLGILFRAYPRAAYYFVQLRNERAENAHILTEFSKKLGITRGRSLQIDEFAKALQDCEGLTLICGSLYLLSEFYLIFPQYLNLKTTGKNYGQ